MEQQFSPRESNRIQQYEDSLKERKGNVLVKCVFCGKDNQEEWCESEGFKIVKCSCGMTYPNPRLSLEEINKLYNNEEISSTFDYLEIEESNRIDFKRRFKLINSFPKIINKVLDVGCNIGTGTKVTESFGWNCKGIDVNKKAIEIAQANGLNCKVEDFYKVEDKFDLIIMNDLIEHLETPVNAIKKSHSLLNEDGLLYISTPKGNSFMNNFTKGNWLHRKPKQHLWIFTSSTITEMLEKNGFEILHLSTIGRIRNIGTIIEKIKVYSEIWGFLIEIVIPKFIKKINLSINLLDEMHLVARKKIQNE